MNKYGSIKDTLNECYSVGRIMSHKQDTKSAVMSHIFFTHLFPSIWISILSPHETVTPGADGLDEIPPREPPDNQNVAYVRTYNPMGISRDH